jgi:hypothetical protein
MALRIAIQPCGGEKAQVNFRRTIAEQVSKARIYPHLNERERILLDEVCGDSFGVWGLQRGATARNLRQWRRLRAGDWVLFYQGAELIARGRVTLRTCNSQLADILWGRDAMGRAWDLVYLLDDVEPINVPIRVIARGLGYAERFQPRSFSVYEGTRARVLSHECLCSCGKEVVGPRSPEVPSAPHSYRTQVAGKEPRSPQRIDDRSERPSAITQA